MVPVVESYLEPGVSKTFLSIRPPKDIFTTGKFQYPRIYECLNKWQCLGYRLNEKQKGRQERETDVMFKSNMYIISKQNHNFFLHKRC